MSAPPKKRSWSWRSKAFRSLIYQVAALVLIFAAGAYLLHNTLENMRLRGIKSGFDFIAQPAGFAIGESIVSFDSAESYGKAFLVGLSNTLRVALAGIVLATVLGTLIGIGRLSQNYLVRSLCSTYVELFRNVPLLLQLFIWYFVLTEMLPSIEDALQPIPDVYFSKNGLQFPIPVWDAAHLWMTVGIVVGIGAAWAWGRACARHFYATGLQRPVVLPGLLIVLVGAVAGWLAGGAPTLMDVPERTTLNLVGGGSVTPEFLTVLIGLTIYTASYIAEIVRSGIQSVPFGQHEASAALGLHRTQEMRFVQLPQALRVIIPPQIGRASCRERVWYYV